MSCTLRNDSNQRTLSASASFSLFGLLSPRLSALPLGLPMLSTVFPQSLVLGGVVGISKSNIVYSSGSGKVDYLCMNREGYTTAWIRDKNAGVDSLGEDVGQVKFAEGWDRANLQFADADGKAFLSWYHTGAHGFR